jgi:hypothetical protein
MPSKTFNANFHGEEKTKNENGPLFLGINYVFPNTLDALALETQQLLTNPSRKNLGGDGLKKGGSLDQILAQ